MPYPHRTVQQIMAAERLVALEALLAEMSAYSGGGCMCKGKSTSKCHAHHTAKQSRWHCEVDACPVVRSAA